MGTGLSAHTPQSIASQFDRKFNCVVGLDMDLFLEFAHGTQNSTYEHPISTAYQDCYHRSFGKVEVQLLSFCHGFTLPWTFRSSLK